MSTEKYLMKSINKGTAAVLNIYLCQITCCSRLSSYTQWRKIDLTQEATFGTSNVR